MPIQYQSTPPASPDLSRNRLRETRPNFSAISGNLAALSPDLRERFEERAAIMEFDAGMSREAAEAAALIDIQPKTETRPQPKTETVNPQPLEKTTMLTVSESKTGNFEMPPSGPIAARCSKLIDLGTQESTYEGETKHQRKLLLSWELAELRTDGTPFVISRRFGLSLHEKAALRGFLQAWRGQPFSAEELAGFDLRRLLSAPCLLNVMHTQRNGKDYANIASISPLPKGMTAPELSAPGVIFDIDAPDAPSVIETLSESLQATIAASPEWQDRIAKGEASPSTVGAGFDADDGGIPF